MQIPHKTIQPRPTFFLLFLKFMFVLTDRIVPIITFKAVGCVWERERERGGERGGREREREGASTKRNDGSLL